MNGASTPGTRIVAIVPAHNEEASIAASIRALLAQTRLPDEIVIACDNCTDQTAEIARQFPVTVLETVGNTHRKSGALNMAWRARARSADIVVCSDGDTALPAHAVADWEREFTADPRLGGSSSQPVMTGKGLLPRIQRAEFTKSAVIGLRRGSTSVISGTGCAFRNEALRQIGRLPSQPDGPWSYDSAVEDFYLTYRLREMHWMCVVSPTVYCLTGSMKTLKALWHQRIKWQAGTVHDLIRFGLNRLTWREWFQQALGLMCIAFWFLWLAVNISAAITGSLKLDWAWLLLPLLFSGIELIHTMKMRGRDWKDFVIAGSLLSTFIYTWLCMGWVSASWWKVIKGSKDDLWAAQYAAEGA
jgi:poly-beta-1,6-N-acetyl-D-glucosamine synthase